MAGGEGMLGVPALSGAPIRLRPCVPCSWTAFGSVRGITGVFVYLSKISLIYETICDIV